MRTVFCFCFVTALAFVGSILAGCSHSDDSVNPAVEKAAIDKNLQGLPEIDRSKFAPMGSGMKKNATAPPAAPPAAGTAGTG